MRVAGPSTPIGGRGATAVRACAFATPAATQGRRGSARGPGRRRRPRSGCRTSPRGPARRPGRCRAGRSNVAAAGDVLPPAGEQLVDRLGPVELGLRHRHLVVADAVDLVGDADRHPLPRRQHVELGEEQVGEAVDAGGVAGDDRVVPAAATVATGRDADLAADLPELLAVLVEQLGRERAGADAGRVGLDHADDPVDARRADAGARAHAAGDRVATTSRTGRCRGRRRASSPGRPRTARSCRRRARG